MNSTLGPEAAQVALPQSPVLRPVAARKRRGQVRRERKLAGRVEIRFCCDNSSAFVWTTLFAFDLPPTLQNEAVDEAKVEKLLNPEQMNQPWAHVD